MNDIGLAFTNIVEKDGTLVHTWSDSFEDWFLRFSAYEYDGSYYILCTEDDGWTYMIESDSVCEEACNIEVGGYCDPANVCPFTPKVFKTAESAIAWITANIPAPERMYYDA